MAPSTTLSEVLASPKSSTKKSRTSLLPAFEPLSSSPALPRPLKRSRDALDERPTYPTPVPTSSTALLTSSPLRGSLSKASVPKNPATLSGRTPLGAVPSVQLQEDGRAIRMGRSSASCDVQLSANRLISRVHVEACYKAAASRLERDRVEVVCSGWNGIKIHCKGQVYEVKKGETFSSDIRDAEIMIDVHDSRVVVQWPAKPLLGAMLSSSDDDDDDDDEREPDQASPTKRPRVMLRHSTPPSPSPLQSRRQPVSPVSPSPAVQAVLPWSPSVTSTQALVKSVEIYVDPEPLSTGDEPDPVGDVSRPTQILSQPVPTSHSSEGNPLSTKEDFSDNDEENDPIVHSFGPFGANLLPRMAAFSTTASPRPTTSAKGPRSLRPAPLQPSASPNASPRPSAQHLAANVDVNVQGHIINQLAFSRLSSTPLSTILSHLPDEAGTLSINDIKKIIRDTRCIGEVAREGKDAAGKPLESEFYYIPDQDEDEKRKEAVVHDLRKPGLRACRKQHKARHSSLPPSLPSSLRSSTSTDPPQQYYWRKPK